jgi:hypothetical protein
MTKNKKSNKDKAKGADVTRPSTTTAATATAANTHTTSSKKKEAANTSSVNTNKTNRPKNIPNPLQIAQTKFLKNIPTKTRQNFFSNKHTDPSTRAEIWSNQADLGEELVNKHAWATPDDRCMKILQHFGSKSGIIEIGCGSNAYWARMMSGHGIDVMAYDSCLGEGGQITDGEKAGNSKDKKNMSKKKRKRGQDLNSKIFDDGFEIHSGDPKALKLKNMKKRVLFLCYPDEDVMVEEGSGSDDTAQSMGAACLEHYKGNTVIHVGELYGDTPSMDQAPWGRSSGPEFQQRLASEYHCILRATLNNWLHVNDTISVWKRTELCSIVFQGEGDDESDDEVEYRHIPDDQRLPTDVAAPCAKHLL